MYSATVGVRLMTIMIMGVAAFIITHYLNELRILGAEFDQTVPVR